MLSPGEQLGPYRIVTRIGKGGMGDVYRATDTRMGRDVAIKVVSDERFMERFDREVRAIAALNHPNICTIHDVGPNYLVMEYVAGEPLRGPLPEATALQHAGKIAVALEAAHKGGIVHRDLKPTNILVAGDRLKLLDFGLASLRAAGTREVPSQDAALTKTAEMADASWPPYSSEFDTLSMGSLPADAGLTAAGTVLGTPAYMSPEQAAGTTADERSDIFSFGAVLFELISGRPPFSGDSLVALLNAVRAAEPAPLQASSEVSQVVARCLRKSPAERFQSMGELRVALERAVASLGKKSVAVLPFVMLGAGDASEYFGEGLSDDIINALSGVSGLKVTSRTSTFAFKDRTQDVKAIAEALGVNYILEGSVRMAANRIRVNAQLIAAQDGTQMWSNRYDRELIDVFEIQDEIANAIASELKVSLTRQELVKAPTAHFAAYEAVLQGRYHFLRFSPEDLTKALSCFERAVEIDPAYPAAHIGIAFYYAGQTLLGLQDPRQGFQLMAKSAREALRLDPANAEGHHCLALFYALNDFDWERAEQHYIRALELNPNLSLTYTCRASYFYSPLRRMKEAVEDHDRALAIEPLALPVLANRAVALECQGDYEAEAKCVEQLNQLDPNFAIGQWLLVRLRARQGRVNEAVELAERLARNSGRWGTTLGALGVAYAAAGRMDDARHLLDELALGHHRESRALYSFVITAALADLDTAFHWGTACVERRDPLIAVYLWSSTFANVRKDPRFAGILRMLKIPQGASSANF